MRGFIKVTPLTDNDEPTPTWVRVSNILTLTDVSGISDFGPKSNTIIVLDLPNTQPTPITETLEQIEHMFRLASI